jgi:hypothetical protein
MVKLRAMKLLALVAAAAILVACGGTAPPPSVANRTTSMRAGRPMRVIARRAPPPYPRVLGSASGSGPTAFVPAVVIGGRPAAWIARSASGIAMLSFDQSVVTLTLHSGTVDAGGSGWRWGPEIGRSERKTVIAAFNGAFKFDTGAGGFMSGGRVGAPLQAGLASIVTYADGSTDVGAWGHGVPARGRGVVSVRQNLSPLIDHGRAASNLDCVSCWGATLGGVSDPARSALGITAHGRLIWAAGEHLTPSGLANALLAAQVVRAVELDVNPEWVAAYLYARHRAGSRVTAVPIVPGQPGVPGQFLVPYSRDFFTMRIR